MKVSRVTAQARLSRGRTAAADLVTKLRAHSKVFFVSRAASIQGLTLS
jgi:hypothetical protein